MTLDIKKIYLKMPIKKYEDLHLKLSTLPKDVIGEYKLHGKVIHGGYIYVIVHK